MCMFRAPAVIVMLCGLALSPCFAAEPDIAKLAWLAGCWNSENAEPGSGEQWMPLWAGTMFGVSRTVKQGKTTAFEFMQLRQPPEGPLTFIAQPSGKPPTVFALLHISDSKATFENLQHDFPQRVIYAREGDVKLRARIEGLHDGAVRAIEFPMSKVGCESQASPSGK